MGFFVGEEGGIRTLEGFPPATLAVWCLRPARPPLHFLFCHTCVTVFIVKRCPSKLVPPLTGLGAFSREKHSLNIFPSLKATSSLPSKGAKSISKLMAYVNDSCNEYRDNKK